MKRKLIWKRMFLLLLLPIIIICLILGSFFIPHFIRNSDLETSTQALHKPTLQDFLKISLEPVGQTMYVWGGGWNQEDTGAGTDATTIGVPARWKEFFQKQDSSYDYTKTLFQIHDGLDCSGFVGWSIYNLMNTNSGNTGYVMLSGEMASSYSENGWGTYADRGTFSDHVPGDILSNDGHVYICLGTCEDGSVLLVHSSPPGVRICGTDNFGTGASDAIELAEQIMKNQYPTWYSKYPMVTVDASYLSDYDRFRWNDDTLHDASKIQSMSADDIVDLLW